MLAGLFLAPAVGSALVGYLGVNPDVICLDTLLRPVAFITEKIGALQGYIVGKLGVFGWLLTFLIFEPYEIANRMLNEGDFEGYPFFLLILGGLPMGLIFTAWASKHFFKDLTIDDFGSFLAAALFFMLIYCVSLVLGGVVLLLAFPLLVVKFFKALCNGLFSRSADTPE